MRKVRCLVCQHISRMRLKLCSLSTNLILSFIVYGAKDLEDLIEGWVAIPEEAAIFVDAIGVNRDDSIVSVDFNRARRSDSSCASCFWEKIGSASMVWISSGDCIAPVTRLFIPSIFPCTSLETLRTRFAIFPVR